MGEGGSQEEYAQLEAICDNAEDDQVDRRRQLHRTIDSRSNDAAE